MFLNEISIELFCRFYREKSKYSDSQINGFSNQADAINPNARTLPSTRYE